jgi:hypothetical protein
VDKAAVGLQKIVDANQGFSGSALSIGTPDAVFKKIKAFIVENFQVQPDLTKKIPLSSERLRTFRLIGKRVMAETSLLALREFAPGDAEVNAILSDTYSSKVQRAGSNLWEMMKSTCETLPSDAKIGKYRDSSYSATTDPELETQRKACEQINIMFDHLTLFKQHVIPAMPQSGLLIDIDGLATNLLEKMAAMSNQMLDVPQEDLDGAAGVLVCLQIRKQELLFQCDDCKRVVVQCLEKYQSTAAGKGTGISKLGFKLAGGKFRPYGEQIAQSYDSFQGYRAAAFRRKTEAYKEDYVLKEMRYTGQIDKDRLLRLFRRFDEEYKAIINQCLQDGFGDAAGSFVITKLRNQVSF